MGEQGTEETLDSEGGVMVKVISLVEGWQPDKEPSKRTRPSLPPDPEPSEKDKKKG